MANLLNFKMGPQKNLAGAALNGGTVYVTTDERAMYIDIDDNTRIRLGDFRIVASFEALQNESDSWATTCLYYVTGSNALAYYNGSKWVLINDTEGLSKNVENLLSTVGKIQTQLTGLGEPGVEGSAKKYVDDADKAISDKIGAIAADVTVASEIARLGGEIDAVEGRMDTAESEIDDLQKDVEALNSFITGGEGSSITDVIDGQIDAAIALLDGSKDSTGSDEIAVKVSTADGVVSEVVVTENLAGKYATIANMTALQGELEGEIQGLDTAIKGVDSAYKAADDLIKADMAKNTAKLSGIDDGTGTVKKYVDDKATALTTTLQTYADGKTDAVKTALEPRIETAENGIKALQSKDTELQKAINALNTKVSVPDGYDSVQAYIDDKDAETLNSANTKAGQLVTALEEGKVATNAANIQTLNTSAANHKGRIEGLEKKAEGYDAQLAGVTTTVVDLVNDAKTYAKGQADAVDAKVTTLSGTVSTNSGLIEGLDAAIKQEAKDREDADKVLDQDITALEDRLDGLGTAKGDVKKYIDDQDDAHLKEAKLYVDEKVKTINGTTEGLQTALNNEIARAKEAEQANAAAAKKANDALGSITNVATAITNAANTAESNAKDYADSELAEAKGELESSIQTVNTAVATEKSRAEGVEAGLRTDVNKANAALGTITDVQDAIDTAKQAAIDSANGTTQSKLDALVGANGQVGKNTKDIETLRSSHNTLSGTVAGHTTELANIKDDADIDSFADVKAYVNDRIQASDAMVFKGTVGNGGTKTSLPTDAQAGDTYKVTHVANPSATQTFAGNICSVGDLLIALVDNPTQDSDWAYVPSGGEDDTDPSLSLNGTTIELKSDAGTDLGKVSIVGAADNNEPENSQLVRVSGSDNKIVIALEWGTF